MDKQQAKELLHRYNQGLASAEEKAMLENWYMQKSDSLYLKDDEIDFDGINEELSTRTFQYAGIVVVETPVKQVKLWRRFAAAAAIILVIGVSIFYYVNPSGGSNNNLAELTANDIAPGSNKAVLTLANGQRISLTDARDGKLAAEANTVIQKTADGQLVYLGGNETDAAPIYNTLNIPIGGQYSLTLSDGTKVVLNAASSLKYPTQFKGQERVVELEGEAYFEVFHNEKLPFRVLAKGQTVEVLGTHFNISAYADDKLVKTTLLTGSVKIAAGNNALILKPGEQSQVKLGHISLVENVDLEDVMAWKNGYFKFNENLESIMAKVSRWYDVDISYEIQPDPEFKYKGEISRDRNLSELLSMLEFTGNVHFKIEGRRVIIKK